MNPLINPTPVSNKRQPYSQEEFRLIQKAMNRGEKSILNLMLRRGTDLNMENEEMKTPLLIAAERQKTTPFEIMIAFGFSIDEKNSRGTTSLIWAATLDNHKMVKKLINLGANINARDINGSTALMRASQGGCKKAVKALLEAGADKNTSDNGGINARDYLISKYKNPPALKSLLNHDDSSLEINESVKSAISIVKTSGLIYFGGFRRRHKQTLNLLKRK